MTSEATLPEDLRVPGRTRLLWILSALILPFGPAHLTRILLVRSGFFPGRSLVRAELVVAIVVTLAVVLLAAGWLQWTVFEIRWRIAIGRWARTQSDETLIGMQEHGRVRSARLVLQHELARRRSAPSEREDAAENRSSRAAHPTSGS